MEYWSDGVLETGIRNDKCFYSAAPSRQSCSLSIYPSIHYSISNTVILKGTACPTLSGSGV